MPKRYYIDERVGCMAVRDRECDAPSVEEPGLWPETTGVVRFFSGVQRQKTCPTCGHKSAGGWTIEESDRAHAEELCDSLNANSTIGT